VEEMWKKVSGYSFMCIEFLKIHVYRPHIRPMESADSAIHVTLFLMLKMCI